MLNVTREYMVLFGLHACSSAIEHPHFGDRVCEIRRPSPDYSLITDYFAGTGLCVRLSASTFRPSVPWLERRVQA